MIKLRINGKEITAKKGMTIMEAANANGIHIPHLCYHSHLTPVGSCRLCVVEVKPGPPRPQPACITPVAENIEVITHSERLTKYRRQLIQLTLINHPLDCPICDKGGECELQNLVRELGVDEQPYTAKKLPAKVDYTSPLIERHSDRCVNCGRCVVVCRDHVGARALYFENRGYHTTVTAGGEPMNCEFCGTCVYVCPVGAIIDKTFKYRARSWEMEKKDAVCPFCGGGCHLELNFKADKLMRVTSDFSRRPNNGIICSRGRFSLDIVNSKERLTSPLVKKNGKLVEVSWNEAFRFVAERLTMIIQQDGPDAIAGLGSPRASNEANYIFQKFIRLAIGTNNIDSTASLDYQNALRALCNVMGRPELKDDHKGSGEGKDVVPRVSGFQLALGSLDDLTEADVVLVVGADLRNEMPLFLWKINPALNHGSLRLYIASFRRTNLSYLAEENFFCHPGSEGHFVLGIIKAIVMDGENNWDQQGNSDTSPLSKLRTELDSISWDSVCRETGIEEDSFGNMAKVLASSSRPCLIFGHDLMSGSTGYEKCLAVADLAAALGMKLKLFPIAEKNNTQGCCDMGIWPDLLPGYIPVDAGGKVEEVWKKGINTRPGLDLPGMIKAMNGKTEKPVKAMYIMGSNPLLSQMNRKELLAGLTRLEFLVCQEIFLNETARLADCVLPASNFIEEEGTYTNTELRVQKNKGYLRNGQVLPDWKIIQEISRLMDYPMDYSGPGEIFSEIARIFPYYGKCDFDQIADEGFIWSSYRNAGMDTQAIENVNNNVVLPNLENIAHHDKEYPCYLVIGKSLFQSGTITRYGFGATLLEPRGKVYISQKDGEKLGVDEGERVLIESERGSIEAEVGFDTNLFEGIALATDHFPDLEVNRLVSDGNNILRVRISKLQ
nr:2Fe-2S iron-sulfur cluster binding domain-containing protein [Desulfobacterales bacterium]